MRRLKGGGDALGMNCRPSKLPMIVRLVLEGQTAEGPVIYATPLGTPDVSGVWYPLSRGPEACLSHSVLYHSGDGAYAT